MGGCELPPRVGDEARGQWLVRLRASTPAQPLLLLPCSALPATGVLCVPVCLLSVCEGLSRPSEQGLGWWGGALGQGPLPPPPAGMDGGCGCSLGPWWFRHGPCLQQCLGLVWPDGLVQRRRVRPPWRSSRHANQQPQRARQHACMRAALSIAVDGAAELSVNLRFYFLWLGGFLVRRETRGWGRGGVRIGCGPATCICACALRLEQCHLPVWGPLPSRPAGTPVAGRVLPATHVRWPACARSEQNAIAPSSPG